MHSDDRHSLTADETARFHELETVVKANLEGFNRAGLALLEIRDARLYRAEFRRLL